MATTDDRNHSVSDSAASDDLAAPHEGVLNG
jgi:hypothetical protein